MTSLTDISLLHDQQAQLDAHIDELVSFADSIVSKYWLWVQTTNKAIKAAGLRGESLDGKPLKDKRQKLISFGPRVERRPSGQFTKYIPNWVHYPYDPRRSKGLKFACRGTRINPDKNNEYPIERLLRYSVGVDAHKIIETEKELALLREMIQALHENKVTLVRRIKRIKRILAKNHEDYPNEQAEEVV